MGERGPLPKPYARRRNSRPTAPKAVLVERPVMPSELPDEAKAEWRRLVPQLEDMQLLARIDRALLIRYVTAWADWVELEGMLRVSGKLIKGQQGNVVRNPLWLMKRDAEQIVTDLARQLGLSPTSRLRAGIKHELPTPPIKPVDAQAQRALFEERRRRLMEDD